MENLQKISLKTINGAGKTKGMITLKVKIYNIEKIIKVFVVDSENFSYDFLVGLDCIENFKLTQTEDLRIIQHKDFQIQGNDIYLNTEANNHTNINVPVLSGDIKEKTKDQRKYEVNFNKYLNTDKFEIKVNHLDMYEQSKIEKLLNKYKSVFARDKYDIGTVKDYEAHIDLMEEKYCYKRPYRCTFEDRKEIENQIAKLLEKGLIEESYSPFAAPVTLAFKKDEKKKNKNVYRFQRNK